MSPVIIIKHKEEIVTLKVTVEKLIKEISMIKDKSTEPVDVQAKTNSNQLTLLIQSRYLKLTHKTFSLQNQPYQMGSSPLNANSTLLYTSCVSQLIGRVEVLDTLVHYLAIFDPFNINY